MAPKTYIVDGRQFRTESDYKDAMHDLEIIEKLRKTSANYNAAQLKALLKKVEGREFHFRTLLGEDFEDELQSRIKRLEAGESQKRKSQEPTGKAVDKKIREKKPEPDPEKERALREAVQRELKLREKRRRMILLCSGLLAIAFLGIFGLYAYQQQRTLKQNQQLGELIGQKPIYSRGEGSTQEGPVQITLDGERVIPDILEEYKAAYEKNKRLIGWLKFDDKDIGGAYGLPVMQTVDNEYYLTHDFDQNTDKNGTIFMDTNCDVLKPSDNFILYGHHMKSGAMFGRLDRYAKESYWKQYPYIQFDTIYEKGIYRVMYVFRSHVYSEGEVTFKYYQFTDAISSQEFDSYMQEMAGMSLYDTGVTAQFGDQLLTLSTCDYQETNGRFVVVAKKVAFRE